MHQQSFRKKFHRALSNFDLTKSPMQESSLFSPTRIGGMVVANRFMRSATWEGLADPFTGLPNPSLLGLIRDLAIGECGLIIPGYVFPIVHGKSARGQTSMEYVCHAEAWRDTIRDVHERGSKIIFQVCHGGHRSHTRELKGHEAIGIGPGRGREMRGPEIDETIDSFIRAAMRLKSVGADGIQIHAAHGFLHSASLSPYFNRRTDKWGGTLENRLRLLYETLASVRRAVGPDFVLSAKVNGSDCIRGGVTPQLCGEYLRRVAPFLDFAEISCGVGRDGDEIRNRIDAEIYRKRIPCVAEMVLERAERHARRVQYSEGYNVDATRIVHEIAPSVKLSVVGGMRDIAAMEKHVRSGLVELVAMARPFLKQPFLVRDLHNGTIRSVDCTSCGMCSFCCDRGVFCHNT
jgi:2,4-dienoyl-CoA reductase-like NADH-dependent reductase (Old Yellow Enzyme family)